MTIIVKPPRYDYCGLSISQYTITLIYCPSLFVGGNPGERNPYSEVAWKVVSLEERWGDWRW